MKLSKKTISILSITLVLFMMFQNTTLAFAGKTIQSIELDFEIIQGEKENQIIVIENGVKSIIETEVVDNVLTTYIYDENYEVLEYFTNDNTEVFSSMTNNRLDYVTFSNGDGTRDNPHKFCTPGTDSINTSELSYHFISLMISGAITATNITAALISLLGYGPAVFETSAAVQFISGIYVIFEAAYSESWLAKHGVRMTFDYKCVLQRHVDNAWNEDVWFYGETTKLTKAIKY